MPRRNHQKLHTPFQPAKTCTDKRPYRSEREALAAAELQMLAHPSLGLSVYKCDQCNNWHLTRRTPRK